MKFLYFDFEFRNNEDPNEIVLVSWMPSDTKQAHTIDLREGRGRAELIQVYRDHQDWVWVAYNAQADLKCLLSLGLDLRPLKVIDAMAEARMVTLTHPDYAAFSPSLLASLQALGIDTAVTEEAKDHARDLILSRNRYTVGEWRVIEAYGPTDVAPLPALMEAIVAVHNEVDSPLTLEEMIRRGEFIKAVSGLSRRTRGFPVDEGRLRTVFENRLAIQCHLKEKAIAQYGGVYAWNTSRADYSWSHKGFEALVDRLGYEWDYTESETRLLLTKDYLKEQAARYPHLLPLYHIRNTCNALNSTDLRDLVRNGYIRPPVYTFSQKTGRNSPKPKQGFLLTLAPWLRSLIKPKPGMAFIGADWSQQEIGIAAALSGDQRYLDAYNKDRDVYLTLAKMAGAVPPEATRKSHPLERQTFKAVLLGLGYGMGVESLGLDVYEANRNEQGDPLLTLEEAHLAAEEIYEWHQETFSDYWEWIWDTIDRARVDGYTRTVDGWTYFVDDAVRATQLLNFPMQANGAAMMRRATIRCWERGRLDLVCTLHDALYINCCEGEREEAIRLLTDCMDGACRDILGNRVKIRVEVKVYDSDRGYRDERGAEMFNEIQELLGEHAA